MTTRWIVEGAELWCDFDDHGELPPAREMLVKAKHAFAERAGKPASAALLSHSSCAELIRWFAAHLRWTEVDGVRGFVYDGITIMGDGSVPNGSVLVRS